MNEQERKEFAKAMKQRLIELGLIKNYSPWLALTIDSIKGKFVADSREQMLKVLGE